MTTEAKAAKAPAPKPTIFVIKARSSLMAQLSGKIYITIPAAFEPPPDKYARILLREFEGGATGRFDIVRFIDVNRTHPLRPYPVTWHVSRTWARSQGGQDDGALKCAVALGYEPKIVDGVILGPAQATEPA